MYMRPCYISGIHNSFVVLRISSLYQGGIVKYLPSQDCSNDKNKHKYLLIINLKNII